MATKDHRLAIETREGIGTTKAHALRSAGKIPAILYGHGSQTQHVAFEAKAFEELLHHGARNALITLTMSGKNSDTALVRDIQRDPVTRKVIHADLQRVSATEEVTTKLPVVTVGSALGVREFGGVLDVILHELEVAGPANKLPGEIEIDVTELGIHDHINAADIKLPQDFKMVTPPETVVVAVEPSKTAAQVEEAATVPVEQAEPEIIGEKPEEPAETAS